MSLVISRCPDGNNVHPSRCSLIGSFSSLVPTLSRSIGLVGLIEEESKSKSKSEFLRRGGLFREEGAGTSVQAGWYSVYSISSSPYITDQPLLQYQNYP